MEKLLPLNDTTTFQLEFGSTPVFINPYLDRLNTLRFTPFEEAIIIKLRLDCHTKWPAFHWDANALESNARDFQRSQWRVRDLGGKYVVVGPKDAATFPRSAIAGVPDPLVTNDLDETSDGVIMDAETVETISELSNSSMVRLEKGMLLQGDLALKTSNSDITLSTTQLIYETNPTVNRHCLRRPIP